MRLDRAKSYPIWKNYNQGSVLKKEKSIHLDTTDLTSMKSLPALDVAF